MLPNVPGFASIYYGILRLGAVVVPMNVLLKERETSFYLSDPEAKAVFAWHDFADAAARRRARGGRGADHRRAPASSARCSPRRRRSRRSRRARGRTPR